MSTESDMFATSFLLDERETIPTDTLQNLVERRPRRVDAVTAAPGTNFTLMNLERDVRKVPVMWRWPDTSVHIVL